MLRRLPLSLERARAEGLIQACGDVGSGRAIYVRRLANELIQSWQAADAGANGANGQDSEDSDLESVDDEDDNSMGQGDDTGTSTLDKFGTSSVLESSGMSAQQRLDEVETQKTLQGLKELGQLLGGQDKKESTADAPDRPDEVEDQDIQCESSASLARHESNCSTVAPSHSSELSQVGPELRHEDTQPPEDDVSTEDESSDDEDPLMIPMNLPSVLREHRWDGYTPDPLNCASLVPNA